MLQRRGGSAGQLGGMRSTCPVHAGSPLTAVCQPEKEVSRGKEERRARRRKVIRNGGRGERENKGMRKIQREDRGDTVMKVFLTPHSWANCLLFLESNLPHPKQACDIC